MLQITVVTIPLLIGLTTNVGCDAYLRYSVKVVDENAMPIENASVQLGSSKLPPNYGPAIKGITNQEGVFEGGTTNWEGAKFDLMVEADGHEKYIEKLPPAKLKNELKVKMKACNSNR